MAHLFAGSLDWKWLFNCRFSPQNAQMFILISPPPPFCAIQDGIKLKKTVEAEEEDGMISNKKPRKAWLAKDKLYGCFVKVIWSNLLYIHSICFGFILKVSISVDVSPSVGHSAVGSGAAGAQGLGLGLGRQQQLRRGGRPETGSVQHHQVRPSLLLSANSSVRF